MTRRHVLLAASALAVGVLAVSPQAASAHGFVAREDLPVPDWLFVYGAAAVLVLSFTALAVFWRSPRLDDDVGRPLPRAVSGPLTSRLLDVLCGGIGLGLLGLVIWFGSAGAENVGDNPVPTFVYVIFWVGFAFTSVLFGDVFRAFNPWRAGGRLVGAVVGRRAPEPVPYPRWLGRWPAVIGLLAFTWLELVSATGNDPRVIAQAALVYSAWTWVAMAVYGVEPWSRKGEAFAVYFNLFSRLSVFERRGATIVRRRLLSGVARLDVLPGTIPVLAVMIGTVSFDGLSGGSTWQGWAADLVGAVRDALGPPLALEVVWAAGMIVAVLVVGGFYRLGVHGARSVDRRLSARTLARAFAPSLVPIAFAYAAAHYLALLLFQGQAMASLASDPLGDGSDLLGTADWRIDYSWLGFTPIWYMQVGLVLAGHLAALAIAHDRALTVYDEPRAASRSQAWMLAVMVGFTCLALWLLSEASKG